MRLLRRRSVSTIAYQIKPCRWMNLFELRCLRSKRVCYRHLIELVSDASILYRLPPRQACALGIGYGERFRDVPPLNLQERSDSILKTSQTTSTSVLVMQSQDRQGNIYYMNRLTLQTFLMQPETLAFSRRLIGQFNAEHAFHIGLSAGIQRRKRCSAMHKIRWM